MTDRWVNWSSVLSPKFDRCLFSFRNVALTNALKMKMATHQLMSRCGCDRGRVVGRLNRAVTGLVELRNCTDHLDNTEPKVSADEDDGDRHRCVDESTACDRLGDHYSNIQMRNMLSSSVLT